MSMSFRYSNVRGAGVMRLSRLSGLVAVGLVATAFQSHAGDAATAAGNAACERAGDAAVGEPDVVIGDCGLDATALDLTLPLPSAASSRQVLPATPAAKGVETQAPLPVAITPGESGASARTGLSVLRDYNAQKLARKVDSAAALSAQPLTAPAAAPGKPALDIWTGVNAEGFDAADRGTLKTGGGIDYRVSPKTTAGLSAERVDGTAAGAGERVSAYVALKAMPALTIDTRTQWETTAEAGGGTSERSAVIVSPRLDTSIALEGGETLAPFVSVTRAFDLESSADAASGAASSTASAGVTLAKPNSYAVSVTTGVSAPTELAPAPAVNGKLEFKLPLP